MNKLILLLASLVVISCNETKKASPEIIEESISEPASEDFVSTEGETQTMYDIYDALYESLKKKNFKLADSIIGTHKEVLFQHEEMRAAQPNCFHTLLLRFSDRNDQKIEVVDYLLKKGFNPNAPSVIQCEEGNNLGYTYSNDYKITELLIKAGSLYAMDGWIYELSGLPNGRPIEGADGDLEVLNKYLDKGADPNLGMIIACGLHDLSLYKKCLSLGGSIDHALRFAIKFEDIPIAQDLISKGAKMRNQNYFNSKLGYLYIEEPAIAHSSNSAIKELVVGNIEGTIFSSTDGPEGCDISMLERAAMEGKLEAVQFMLEAGADPNVYCCDWGPCSSPLRAAQENNQTEIVELLKNAGAKLPDKE